MTEQGSNHIESAYERLQVISQDKEKSLEYEALEKAILDHNQMILEAEERGEDRINKLYALLIHEKRFKDLERAAMDKDFQRQLMLQYGIWNYHIQQ